MVRDRDRSWHAGISEWRGDTDLDNSSIGIEITNLDGNKHPYPEEQIEAVIFLVKNLADQYEVDPVQIIGHSDIAPTRKIDPGSYFPWKTLFDFGFGAWYDEKDIDYYKQKITSLPSVDTMNHELNQYGYQISLDYPLSAVMAFQRHFAPESINGTMSLDQYIILRALLKKYNGCD